MYSIQKFHRLLCEGLIGNNIEVDVLSALPVSPRNNKRKVWKSQRDEENRIHYRSIPFLNFSIVRHVCLFLYSFFYTLAWCCTKTKHKRAICDVLNTSVCMGALLASKIIGIKTYGIVTDMPGLMVSDSNVSVISRLSTFVQKRYLSSFDGYVFLTEQMNPVINIHGKPYIIVEGLVDVNMQVEQRSLASESPRTIIYAGGLYEQYGVKMLLDAFTKCKIDNIAFSVYGMGQLEKEMPEYEKKDPRIHFHGVVPNEQVVRAELGATLLVNPRPTHEDFVKYSFPSKNMEYMVSGTPVLTTKLPGMPPEYYPHVYLFSDETIDGFLKTLNEVLSLPSQTLDEKGNGAKRFVLENKNNIVQAKKVADFMF